MSMRNLVIILGAGASFEFGAPLMKDFYRVASEIFVNSEDKTIKEHFSIVFEFINRLQKAQAKANIDLHNIEQVYTALEMAKLLGLEHLRASGKSWSKMEDSMRFFLTHNIESRSLLPPSPNMHAHHQNSQDPARLGMKKPNFSAVAGHIQVLKKYGWNVSILSFNYDLVTEAVLSQQHIKVDYCLDKRENINDNNIVPLLKLHGSINWQPENKNRQVSIKVTPYEDLGNYKNSHLYSTTLNNKVVTNISKHFTPFVIPPVWNKATYQSSLSKVWKTAAKKLSEASHVYCLGYSLPVTDGFFKQLYALGTIGNSPFLQFRVFDIEPADKPMGVNSRYLELLGRGAENVFSYDDSGSKGFVNSLLALSKNGTH